MRTPTVARADHATLHALVLLLCCGMVTAAWILQFSPKQPSRLCLFAKPLPEVCLFKRVSGIPCPGCGLAHSWVAAMHGQFSRSWQYHRLGGLILVYTLLQIAIRLVWFIGKRYRQTSARISSWLDRSMLLIILLLFANWILALILSLLSELIWAKIVATW